MLEFRKHFKMQQVQAFCQKHFVQSRNMHVSGCQLQFVNRSYWQLVSLVMLMVFDQFAFSKLANVHALQRKCNFEFNWQV